MIADYILEQDPDICCLTETWLNADDPVTIGELCPNGYKLISIPRKDRRGGGVAVVLKNHYLLSKTVLMMSPSTPLNTSLQS